MDLFYNPITPNGKWIYLSPAHHWAGPNYGCGSYVEDDNTERSNNWGSNRHISMHSNASSGSLPRWLCKH